ncbi:hypothetical protein A2U01_0113027, partial [Trifolium medium]|nr:hypothetical protein [Trifolium medium]
TQPSPAQSLNTGAAEGCEVAHDAAVLPAVVVAVVLQRDVRWLMMLL